MKIKIKDLIEFAGYSDRRKSNLVERLRLPAAAVEEIEVSEGGGDYWVRCISAIKASCKENDLSFILQKIDDINNDRRNTQHRPTIDKYDRNLRILHNFSSYNFLDFFPEQFELLEKTVKEGELQIGDFYLKAKIHIPFSFEEDGIEKVGAILFVARKDRYTKSELGIFAELMYRFVEANYSDNYQVAPEHILVVDVTSTESLNYASVLNGQVPSQLNNTLNEIQRLLRY